MSNKNAPKKQILPSEVARALGSVKSERKAKSSAANVAAYQFKARPLEDYECTCGGCPDAPKTTCPRGRIIRQRERTAAKRHP